jgi:hypothetical protein
MSKEGVRGNRFDTVKNVLGAAALLVGTGLGAEQIHARNVAHDRNTSIGQDEQESWHTLTEAERKEAALHVGRRLVNGHLLEGAHSKEEVDRMLASSARQYLRTKNQLNRGNVEQIVEELRDRTDLRPGSGSFMVSVIDAAGNAHTDTQFQQLDRTLDGFNHNPDLFARAQPLGAALNANNGDYVAHIMQRVSESPAEGISAAELDIVIGMFLRASSHRRGDLEFIHTSLARSPQTFAWFANTLLPKMERAFADRNHWNQLSADRSVQSEFDDVARFVRSLRLSAEMMAMQDRIDAASSSPEERPRHRHRHHE